MLSLLFIIFFFWIFGKMIGFAFRASWSIFHASGSAGGLTPMLDRDGNPIISPVENR